MKLGHMIWLLPREKCPIPDTCVKYARYHLQYKQNIVFREKSPHWLTSQD